MRDVALALDALVPEADYSGSLTSNDRAAFDALDWHDQRPKPDWVAIEAEMDSHELPELRAAAKARRDMAVEAGTTVNGVLMPTDAKSREMISGAAFSAMLDTSYTANWKMPDGTFMRLGAAQIIGIASAIRAHVQACFDREAELIAEIEAGAPYDIEAGWPS